MAATEGDAAQAARVGSGLLAAALALPGCSVQAADMPTETLVAFKWLGYQDWQPGLKRVRVEAPSLRIEAPVGERWSLAATATQDSVSGASPRYHSAVSGASVMSDRRQAGDVKLTQHGERSSWRIGAAGSDEHDFRSRALSLEGSWSSEDNNRQWHAGLGFTRDRIGSTDDASLHARRRTVELNAGLTQVLSAVDVVQLDLTLADGQGHYSDPYKRIDRRPEERRQRIVLLRWNHHLEGLGATLRTSWRWYGDSFGIRSHTVSAEWVQALSPRWALTPSLRAYTQRAAWFYYDPVYSYAGPPLPPGYLEHAPAYLSPDARLAGFGALTAGLKLALRLTGGWTADLRVDHYAQRGGWRLDGDGSPGLAPLRARFVQVGVARRF